jgi:hypothetical protein
MEVLYPGISITEEVYWTFDFFKNPHASSSNRAMGVEQNGE